MTTIPFSYLAHQKLCKILLFRSKNTNLKSIFYKHFPSSSTSKIKYGARYTRMRSRQPIGTSACDHLQIHANIFAFSSRIKCKNQQRKSRPVFTVVRYFKITLILHHNRFKTVISL